jgi:hypothetical protein
MAWRRGGQLTVRCAIDVAGPPQGGGGASQLTTRCPTSRRLHAVSVAPRYPRPHLLHPRCTRPSSHQTECRACASPTCGPAPRPPQPLPSMLNVAHLPRLTARLILISCAAGASGWSTTTAFAGDFILI